MYYTYGHYKADSKQLFYIGKGKGRRAHEKDSRSDYWRNIVNKYGYTVEIFAEWESEQDAFIHEKFLIECFQDLTDLCNLTDGGDGCSGYVWTEEQKAKLKLRTKMKQEPEPKLNNFDYATLACDTVRRRSRARIWDF